MNTPDTGGKGSDKETKTPSAGSSASSGSSSTGAAGASSSGATASGPASARAHVDPTTAITMIETLKKMVLSAPTEASRSEAITRLGQLAATSPGAWNAAMEVINAYLGTMPASETSTATKVKRAICLAGGGPAVGLHIGALKALKDKHVDFGNENSIWALSCIGAWVGIVYNQATKGKEIEETYNFFREVFRDDKSFQSFPINTVFTPDWVGNAEALLKFLLDPENYKNAFLPRHMMESLAYTLSLLRDRDNWRNFSEGDFNRWTLNHVLAVNPMARFLTAMIYKSAIDGRSRLYYKDSKFLTDIKFDELNARGRPFIFHNAFNFRKQNIDIFANKSPRWGSKGHKPVSAESLCACSALPYIEQTIKVDGETYCEGALVDTVNFYDLLKDHHHPDDPLDEIWVSRIVDVHQIRKPANLHDALANLCELFAATVGEDDVKLFKYHVHENNRRAQEWAEAQKTEGQKGDHQKGDEQHKKIGPVWDGILVEMKVDSKINFQWSRSNLDHGVSRGRLAAEAAHKLYEAYKHLHKPGTPLMIPDDLKEAQIRDVLQPHMEESDIKAVIGSR